MAATGSWGGWSGMGLQGGGLEGRKESGKGQGGESLGAGCKGWLDRGVTEWCLLAGSGPEQAVVAGEERGRTERLHSQQHLGAPTARDTWEPGPVAP